MSAGKQFTYDRPSLWASAARPQEMRVPIFNQVQRGFDPRTLANLTLFVLIPAWLFGGATRFDVLAPVLPMAAGLLLLALLAVTPGRRPLSIRLVPRHMPDAGERFHRQQ